MVGWTSSSLTNKVKNTAQASVWGSALSQPAMGETFCFPIIRIVYVKEFKVLPHNIESHY